MSFGASSGDIAYSNQDVPGSGEDLTQSFESSYDRIASVSDGTKHSISGFNTITWTQDDTPSGNGVLIAGWKNGSELDISANAINISAIFNGTEKKPNLIHAYGATVNLTIRNDGGALMSQAVANVGNSLLKVNSDTGNVTVSSTGAAVIAGLLQEGLDGYTSKVEISAKKNVTLNSATGPAIQLNNKNPQPPEWTGSAGSASVDVEAGDTLILNGGWGVYQKVENDKVSSTTQTTLKAGNLIDVTGILNAVTITGEVKDGNKTTFEAPNINLTSTREGVSTILAETNADIIFDNGSKNSVVNIISNKGAAIEVKDSTSSIGFNKSAVNATGNVISQGTLDLKDSNFNLKDGSTFQSSTVSGSNSSITINKLPAEGSTDKSVSITHNLNQGLSITAGGELNDTFDTPEEAAAALKNAISISNKDEEGNETGSYGFSGQDGVYSDAFTADDQGKVTSRTLNSTLDSYGNYTAMTLLQWRNEVNHISQRLGDVRDASKTVGAWARVYGYDSSYNDNVSIGLKANAIQVGGDYRLNNTWLVGGAFSYTNGDGTLSNGTADTDGYSLAAYLSGFFDCGAYIDFVGRVGRLSTDITTFNDATTFKGSYDNTTFGLSAEVGYRLNLNKTFYVEPQAELAYGYVKGDDFTASNGVSIEQDNLQTLVGRFGARVGASFAEGAGTVFAHASVNHDFLGDVDYKASYKTNAPRDLSVDIGGTWYTYGVGAQFNTSKNLNFYGTLERSNGSDYQEDYRYSVGMSYRF